MEEAIKVLAPQLGPIGAILLVISLAITSGLGRVTGYFFSELSNARKRNEELYTENMKQVCIFQERVRELTEANNKLADTIRGYQELGNLDAAVEAALIKYGDRLK